MQLLKEAELVTESVDKLVSEGDELIAILTASIRTAKLREAQGAE